MTKKLLEGIKVIDWTVYQFGPVGGAMLADLGADVIKIESPVGDPGRTLGVGRGRTTLPVGHTAYFENGNRNKRGIVLDLNKPEARDVMYKLVEHSDVFMQNFRKGVAERLGMGYEDLKKHNPMLIYASGSAFGPDGPMADMPGYDTVGQAYSGLMFQTVTEGNAPRQVGGGIADQMGGTQLFMGILAGLVARNIHGIGQKIDVSHLGGMVWLQGTILNSGLLGKSWTSPGDRTAPQSPMSNSYQCKDGRWLQFVFTQPDRYWPGFCRAVGREDLIEDPRFSTNAARAENSRQLVQIFDKAFATKTSAEWAPILRKEDLIYSPVMKITELENDEQILSNDYIVEFEHPTLGKVKETGHPIRYSETPAEIGQRPAPKLGEHTDEILSQLGFNQSQVGKLRQAGAVK
jgi:crotonobetainyl-CoA:carnitine CoA-transferase CaiB-like acyl-CoA transferase